MSQLISGLRILGNVVRFALLRIKGADVRNNGMCTCLLSDELSCSKGGSLIIGRHFAALKNCRILVRAPGQLVIGENVGLNTNCSVVCHEAITVGNNVQIGPNTCIYDHDHIWGCKDYDEGYYCTPVRIGSNVWIGANVVILRGSVIGDNCIIAAGSIVKEEIPDGPVFYQYRESRYKHTN